VRLYDRLFTDPDPESDGDVDFRARLNPQSLVTIEQAWVEPSVAGADPGARFQFERLGYFTVDTVDSTADTLVFNRTVTLRDTWAKIAPGASQTSAGRPDRSAPKRQAAGQGVARSDATGTGRANTGTGRAAAGAARGTADDADLTAPGAAPVHSMPRGSTSGPRDAQLEGRKRRLVAEMSVPAAQADVLTRDLAIANFFDDAIAAGATPRTVAMLLANDMPREARENVGTLPVDGAAIGALAHMIDGAEISSSAARDVLEELLERGGDPATIVDRRGLRQVSDEATLRTAVNAVLAGNTAKVDEYRAGKTGLLGFFVGQAMAKTAGTGNPAVIRKIVEEALGA
jgi:glutaminyl-tRNA synthetase